MVSISRTKWLRILAAGLIVLALLVLCGCAPLFPLKTPYDYPDSVWESEEPHVYLHVVDQYSYNAEAYIEINNDKVPILFFADKKSAYGSVDKKNTDNTSDTCLFTMDWKCYSDKIEVRIVYDYVFDEKYDEFVMYRKDK